MKIISGILILVTAFLSLKHGWSGVTMNLTPSETQMMSDLGLNKTGIIALGVLSLTIGIMVLLPWTFFVGNFINALTIVSIMAFSLRAGNVKTALIEIPFLLIPLVLIWLGHPLTKAST